MAILKIARMGHPVLMAPARAVADPTDEDTRRLVADMIETMADAPGIGLAAPQVHVPKRVVVFFLPDERTDDGEDDVPLTVLVNPRITPLGEEISEDWEGCLSLPGLTGMVPRHARIRYRGITPDGGIIEREADGMHARLVQHEYDHLDGILYPMRMTDLSTFGFKDDMARGGPDQEAEE